MSVHPSGGTMRVTPSNLPSTAWASAAARSNSRTRQSSTSNRSNQPIQLAPPPANPQVQHNGGAASRSRSREPPRRVLQPAHHLSIATDVESYPFAAASVGSRSSSRSRPDVSPGRVARPPTLHTSRRYPDGPRLSRPLLESGYIQNEAAAANTRAQTLAEQYAALQDQHTRITAASPTHDSPVRQPRPASVRPRSAKRSNSLQRSPARLQQQSQHQQHQRSASQQPPQQQHARQRQPLQQSYPQESYEPSSANSSGRLDAHALDEHERLILAAAHAANAPHPLLTSPARSISPFPRAALQNELTSLDQQIRQNTKELLLMQQQQQQRQAGFQHVSYPSHSSSSSWHRASSPSFRPVSPAHHSTVGSGYVPASHSSSRPPSTLPPPPEGSALHTVPVPTLSKNNPFGSLVDAIDNVLAKAGGNGGSTTKQQEGHPQPTQLSLTHIEPIFNFEPQQHQSSSSSTNAHAQLQQQAQQFQAWQIQQQQQQQQSLPQQHKSQMQILSETSSSLSPQHTTSSFGERTEQPSHLSSSAAYQQWLHTPSAQSAAYNNNNTDDPDLQDDPPHEWNQPFDEHPELFSQGTIESLKLANMLLKDKGSTLLKKHSALKLKFRAVRTLLSEYYRKKDREVALMKLDDWVRRKGKTLKVKAVQQWKRVNLAFEQRKAKQILALKSLLNSSITRASTQRTLSLRISFTQWKEIAIRLAMRSVQNQWMRDWENDIREESRKTALAQVLLRAQNREKMEVYARTAQGFMQWRLTTIYHRVKQIFHAHSQEWNKDKEALLQLVLEANGNREAIQSQAQKLHQEYLQLKGQYENLSHIAVQNDGMTTHLAQVTQDLHALKQDRHTRAGKTKLAAAKILATTVWTVRCKVLRRAWRKWGRQAQALAWSARSAISQSAQNHNQNPQHSPQGQGPSQSSLPQQQYSQVPFIPATPGNHPMHSPTPQAQAQTHAPSGQNQHQPHQQQQQQHSQQYLSLPAQTFHGAAPIPHAPIWNGQMLPAHAHPPQAVSAQPQGSPYPPSASPYPLASPNQQQSQYFLPQGSPFQDLHQHQQPRQSQSQQQQPGQFHFAQASPVGSPMPAQPIFPAQSPAPPQPAYAPGSLQQLAASPHASLLSPRSQASFDGVLESSSGGGPPDDVEERLRQFEQAKLQLEAETASLAARLASTRNMQQRQQGGQHTVPVQQPQPFGLPPVQQRQQPVPIQQPQMAPQQPQPLMQTPHAQLTQFQGTPAAQQHHQQQLSSRGHSRSNSQSDVTLEQYAPSGQTGTSIMAGGSGAEESFIVDASFGGPGASQSHAQSSSLNDTRSPEQSVTVNGLLSSSPTSLIQPPLMFDEGLEPTSMPTSRSTSMVAPPPPQPQPVTVPAAAAPAKRTAVPTASSSVATTSMTSSTQPFFQQPPPPNRTTSLNLNANSSVIYHSGKINGAPQSNGSTSPTRTTLLSSVFLEFSRAHSLRQRAALGSRYDSATVDGHMSVEDVPKAIRKAGLRAGDLPTAKMTDTRIQQMCEQRGWTQQPTITQTEFQSLANGILFQQ